MDLHQHTRMSERNFSFAIFFTLLGLGVGTGLLFTGVLTSPQRLQYLYQPRGLGILGGGLLLSLFLGVSAVTRRHLMNVIWDLLTDNAEPNKQGALNECVMLATRTREAQGQELKLYREIKPYLQHATLRLGLDFLIAAYPEALIRETLERHREQRLWVYRQCAEALRFLGHASLALGTGAAAIGALRAHLIAPGVLSFYMAGIGLPLGLGLLLYAIVFLPLQQKMRFLEQDWSRYEQLNMMGVLLLQGKHHAHYVETTLKAYLPHENLAPAMQRPAAAPTVAPVVSTQNAPMPSAAVPLNPADSASDDGSVPMDFQAALHQEELSQEPLSRQQLSRFRPVKRNLPPS